MPAGKRIHDFEIVAIGLSNGIKQIGTQNVSDFKNVNEITVVSL